jgi:hypothetical protein
MRFVAHLRLQLVQLQELMLLPDFSYCYYCQCYYYLVLPLVCLLSVLSVLSESIAVTAHAPLLLFVVLVQHLDIQIFLVFLSFQVAVSSYLHHISIYHLRHTSTDRAVILDCILLLIEREQTKY